MRSNGIIAATSHCRSFQAICYSEGCSDQWINMKILVTNCNPDSLPFRHVYLQLCLCWLLHAYEGYQIYSDKSFEARYPRSTSFAINANSVCNPHYPYKTDSVALRNTIISNIAWISPCWLTSGVVESLNLSLIYFFPVKPTLHCYWSNIFVDLR